MKGLNGYNNAREITGDFERLPAGGYVCKIVKVEDVPAKEYLKIYYDINEGDYRGWWRDKYAANGNEYWPGSFIRSYKDKALGFFKGFISAVDESNATQLGPTVESGLDEQRLVGLGIGLVIAYEQYEARDHSIKERTYIAKTTTPQKIFAGDFKVPELKLLAGAKAQAAAAAPGGFDLLDDDETLPF